MYINYSGSSEKLVGRNTANSLRLGIDEIAWRGQDAEAASSSVTERVQS